MLKKENPLVTSNNIIKCDCTAYLTKKLTSIIVFSSDFSYIEIKTR